MNPSPPRPRLTALALAAVPLAVHAFLAWRLRSAAIGTGQDDAVYLLLGRGLRDFTYSNYWLVPTTPHGAYPPLYPLILGLTSAVFGDSTTPALVLSVLFSTLALGILFSIAWRWSPPAAFLALSVSAVNPWLVRLAGMMFSEPFYLLCTALTLWFLTVPTASARSRFGAGALALGSFLARVIGITMIVAVLFHWLVERRRRTALGFAIVGLLCAGAWFVHARIAGGALTGQSYIADVLSTRSSPPPSPDTVAQAAPSPPPPAAPAPAPAPSPPAPVAAAPSPPVVTNPGQVASVPAFVAVIVKRVISNLPAYLSRRVPSVLAFPTISDTTLDNWLGLVLIVGLGALGLFELARRLPGAAIYLLAYAGVLLVWPFSIPRYLAPVIPLLLLVLFLGFVPLVKRAKALAWTLLPLLALVLVVSGFRQNQREIAAMARCDRSAPFTSEGCFDPVERGFFEAVRQADREAPADAVFMSPKMAILYFLTGRRSIDERTALNYWQEALHGHLKELGVQYILFSRIHQDQRWLAERLQSSCGEWELRGEYAGGALLFRRVTGQTPEATRATCEALSRFVTGPW